MFKKIIKGLKNPQIPLLILLRKCSRLITNDERYIRMEYYLCMGKRLNLNPPITFNEKLQWLKLHDRNPKYTDMVDKYEVKKIIAEKLGEEYVIPTLGVWERFEDIDFEQLPNQFVLKCTHDSGGLVICKDKSQMDMNAVRKKLNKCLACNYYYRTREYPYKNVKPRIIAEKYMVDESGTELKDYKFFCFNGGVRCLFVVVERFNKNTKHPFFKFFDRDFKGLPFWRGYQPPPYNIEKPTNYNKMVELAEFLSKEMPFVRIDFYNINGQIYFGEFTFTPGNGVEPFHPEEWDKIVGDWLEING